MGKKPSITNIRILEDHSNGSHISMTENSMYIEPSRNDEEIKYWKQRIEMQGLPYIYASIEYARKDPDTNVPITRRGRTFFIGEVDDVSK